MRLLAAATVMSIVLAATAAVFAIWPVVGDAPWEEKAPVPSETARDEIRCEGALRLREAALGTLQGADRAAIFGLRSTVDDALEDAEREIERYC